MSKIRVPILEVLAECDRISTLSVGLHPDRAHQKAFIYSPYLRGSSRSPEWVYPPLTDEKSYKGRIHSVGEVGLYVPGGGPQYAKLTFGGVKAYEQRDGSYRILEPLAHAYRLGHSCWKSGLTTLQPMPVEPAQIVKAMDHVVQATVDADLHKDDQGNNLAIYIRPNIFLGGETTGVASQGAMLHFLVHAWPWGNYFPEEKIQNGLSLVTGDLVNRDRDGVRKPDPLSAAVTTKAAENYALLGYVKTRALVEGFDDALIQTIQGEFIEATAANLAYTFNRASDVIVIPEPGRCLFGITMQIELAFAKACGYKVIQGHVFPRDLKRIREGALTGTAAGAQKIASHHHKWDADPYRFDVSSSGLGARLSAIHNHITRNIPNEPFLIPDTINPRTGEFRPNWPLICRVVKQAQKDGIPGFEPV
jgi:branched-subunit amino acid aminotransferase/4-amino-4-deoxychorismate lyase